MTKNINYVSHKKSKVKSNGKPQLPSASALVEGEIAINYAENVETLSIKNESGTVVTFSSDNYYTEQKLGSGFTGVNSAKTVTDAIGDAEEVLISSGITPINNNIELWVDTSVDPVTVEVYTKDETNSLLNTKLSVNDFNTYSGTVDTALSNKLEASDVADFFDDAKYEDSGTSKVINFYHGSTIKATINADDFIKDGMISGVTLESKSGTTYLVINWNTDAGIETTELNIGDLFEADNYYQKTETSGATELSTAFAGKASQTDLETVSGTVTSHTASINDLSGQSETIAAALVDLSENKTDLTAFTAHTANTSVHVSQSLLDEIDTLKKAIYSENGHPYVEIGGVKWATMNIGASSITDYGQYFQWGSTTGFLSGDVGSNSTALKKPVGWADYKFGNGTSSPGATGMTKYNSGDTKTVLDLSDDAARANWGGSWRMPTIAEFQALGNAVTTAWTASYQGSGVAGMICTAKDGSGAELFFPAAGVCGNGSVSYVGSYGYYWSSSLLSSIMQRAYNVNFGDGYVGWQYGNDRSYGFLVRGVVG